MNKLVFGSVGFVAVLIGFSVSVLMFSYTSVSAANCVVSSNEILISTDVDIDDVVTEFYVSVLDGVYCSRIVVDGVVSYSPSIAVEISRYNSRLELANITNALNGFSSIDVDGDNAYRKLKLWASQFSSYADNWGSLTNSDKDFIVRKMVRRSSVFYDRFADLLLILELEQ